MSIIVKKVHGDEYVYFQTYEEGRKSEEYVGRGDDPAAWMEARGRLAQYRDREMTKQMEVLDRRIAQQLKLTRRRLLQSPEKKRSAEGLAQRLEPLASNSAGAIAYHPVLKDELAKLLHDMKKIRSDG